MDRLGEIWLLSGGFLTHFNLTKRQMRQEGFLKWVCKIYNTCHSRARLKTLISPVSIKIQGAILYVLGITGLVTLLRSDSTSSCGVPKAGRGFRHNLEQLVSLKLLIIQPAKCVWKILHNAGERISKILRRLSARWRGATSLVAPTRLR